MKITLIILIIILIILLFTLYLGVKIVPEGEEWIVEYLGKFSRELRPGLNIIWPYVEKVRAKIDTRDSMLDIPQQEVITKDNAVLLVNAVAYIRVINVINAVYGVGDYRRAIKNLVMTTLRSLIGNMTLDDALSHREEIKKTLKAQLIEDIADWGVTVKLVEIQDITPSKSMQESMEKQAAAEREKRAKISNAEGDLEAAKRHAQAELVMAEATAKSIKMISANLHSSDGAILLLGEKYINSLEKLSKSDNAKVIIYPADIQTALEGIVGKFFIK